MIISDNIKSISEMSLPVRKDFELENKQIRISFCLEEQRLTVELWVHEERSIFNKVFTNAVYHQEMELKSYFHSTLDFFYFISQLNDEYIAADRQGRIAITIFAEELQQKTILIQLNKQSEADLFLRVESLQNAHRSLAKEVVSVKQGNDGEVTALKREVEKMKLTYENSLRVMQRSLSSLSQYFEQGFKDQLYKHKKHQNIGITQRKIMNPPSSDYEIRWAIIGPEVSQQKNTYLMVKANKINWLAIGFCHEEIIQSRKYTRFNGTGQHGAYVMDSTGWTYAHEHHESNYKQLGFSFSDNDSITLIYNPKESVVAFFNHITWQRCELRLKTETKGLFPCIACNMETDIEILDYLR